MKRTTLLLLTTAFVLSVSISALAAGLDHEGTLNFYWDKDSQLTHSEWAQLTYDLRKNFGNGIDAGLSIKMSPSENEGGFQQNWDGWANMDLEKAFVSLSSWKEFTGAQRLMATGRKLQGGPGITVDFKQIDDVNLQAHLGNYWDSGANRMVYTYGAKASTAVGQYTLGAGYHTKASDHDPLADKPLYGIFAFADTKVSDGVTFSAELGLRTDLEDWRFDGANWFMQQYHSGTALTVEMDYNKNGIVSSLLVVNKAPFFIVKDWDNDAANNARDLFLMSEWTGTLLSLDLEREVVRYLTLKGRLDYLLGVTDSRHDSNSSKVHDINPFGYRLEASYRASLGSTVSGWYRQYGDVSQAIGVGYTTWEWDLSLERDMIQKFTEASATYSFADGFEGVLKMNQTDGFDMWYGAELNISL